MPLAFSFHLDGVMHLQNLVRIQPIGKTNL